MGRDSWTPWPSTGAAIVGRIWCLVSSAFTRLGWIHLWNMMDQKLSCGPNRRISELGGLIGKMLSGQLPGATPWWWVTISGYAWSYLYQNLIKSHNMLRASPKLERNQFTLDYAIYTYVAMAMGRELRWRWGERERDRDRERYNIYIYIYKAHQSIVNVLVGVHNILAYTSTMGT